MFFKRIFQQKEEILAGAEGFEPSVTDPKSVALPLGYAPIADIFYR